MKAGGGGQGGGQDMDLDSATQWTLTSSELFGQAYAKAKRMVRERLPVIKAIANDLCELESATVFGKDIVEMLKVRKLTCLCTGWPDSCAWGSPRFSCVQAMPLQPATDDQDDNSLLRAMVAATNETPSAGGRLPNNGQLTSISCRFFLHGRFLRVDFLLHRYGCSRITLSVHRPSCYPLYSPMWISSSLVIFSAVCTRRHFHIKLLLSPPSRRFRGSVFQGRRCRRNFQAVCKPRSWSGCHGEAPQGDEGRQQSRCMRRFLLGQPAILTVLLQASESVLSDAISVLTGRADESSLPGFVSNGSASRNGSSNGTNGSGPVESGSEERLQQV